MDISVKLKFEMLIVHISIIIVLSMMRANNWMIGYIMVWRFIACILHYLIIIIRQTYPKGLYIWNVCRAYSVACVPKINSILSTIFYEIYGTVCFQLHISLLMIMRIFVLHLIIIKSEIWVTSHCLGLGHKTVVCAVCMGLLLFMHIVTVESTWWWLAMTC